MIYILTVFLSVLAAPAAYWIGKKSSRAMHVLTIAACLCTLVLSALPILLKDSTDFFSLLGLRMSSGGLGGLYGVLTALQIGRASCRDRV